MAEAAQLDDLADSLPPPVEADAGGDDVAVAEAPAAAGAEPPSTSSEEDPLDRLLADYDRSIGAGGNGVDDVDPLDRLIADAGEQEAAARREQEFRAEQQRYVDAAAQSSIAITQRDQQVAELQATVGQLQNVIAQEQFRQHQQRSSEDFERLAAGEEAKLDGLDVDENHVKRWMLSEAAQDSNLAAAWEARYYQPPGPLERARIAADIQQWGENQARLALQLPGAARVLAQQNIEASMRQMWETAFPDPAAYRANAARYVHKALDRMHKEARRPRIDVDATESRLLVPQAVRGASGKIDVREPPPNFSQMSDGEFARTTKQLYGF